MIIRIFRVRVHAELTQEFEQKFQHAAAKSVAAQPGVLSVVIGKPTHSAADEYVMISTWKDQQSLINFAGPAWDQAVIQPAMARYIDECWIHHYTAFDAP